MSVYLSLIQDVFISCADWFTDIFNSSSVGQFWVSCIVLILCFRFFVNPIFGSSFSDKARKSSKKVDC